MFEKRTRQRVRSLLENQLSTFHQLDQSLKFGLVELSKSGKASVNRSPNERNMTRKTRSRRPRIHSVFQSGYCAVCHTPYSNLEDHIQSKKHLKLIGEDGEIISIKGFESLLALDGIDAIEVNGKSGDFPPIRRGRMPRTRTSSVMCDQIKDSPMSPVGSDSGHRLRSRKNINYMTPPSEDDSLTEKPEIVKEYRELRSSSRLLAKLADQMVDSEEVWNSGRPKRSCNRRRPSIDKMIVDNRGYYRVDLKPRTANNLEAKGPDTTRADGLIVKFKKLRNSELVRLNNEAENFLFPKKEDSSDSEEEKEENESDKKSKTDNSSISEDEIKNVKVEDEESMHSTSSESKGKKRRRTHAEAFIMDNQKYYKFETPGSRLRYHGSYLSPVPMKVKNNGDCLVKEETEQSEAAKSFSLNLSNYSFSFENVPKREVWYQTFQRRDRGEEKYIFLSDDSYLVLPYQLDPLPPIDPRDCVSQYNQLKKFLMEPAPASPSVSCSTPDPTTSNSSVETLFHDEDTKASATEVSSNSTLDEIKPIKRGRRPVQGNGSRNPRKSPRQHASTLAILSSLIQQRKRKRRGDLTVLPTILEEPKRSKSTKKTRVDYVTLLKNVEEEFGRMCKENVIDVELEEDDGIEFRNEISVQRIFEMDDNVEEVVKCKKITSGKPGRKPGKRKKNRTGWPINRSRRTKRTREDDDSTIDSLSVNADSEEETQSTDSIKKKERVEKLSECVNKQQRENKVNNSGGKRKNRENKVNGSENNNRNDQSSLGDSNCDSSDDRVDKVLTNKVNSDGYNVHLQYQPYVRVQKLDKNHIDNKGKKRENSPKRTNRGKRRMPASPRSPRMLRRPRGRWYRER